MTPKMVKNMSPDTSEAINARNHILLEFYIMAAIREDQQHTQVENWPKLRQDLL